MINRQYDFKRMMGVVTIALCVNASNTFSAEVTAGMLLSVKPDKCIALHKGQTCYQKLVFSWRTPIEGEFCLYKVSNKKPLICWTSKGKNKVTVQFESDKSETYQIRMPNDETVLTEVSVRLATVYRQSKKSYSGWRLF